MTVRETRGAADQWRTVTDALDAMTAQLTATGIEGARQDALKLVLSACGITREQLIVNPQLLLKGEVCATLQAMLKRRLHHEPISKILGESNFFGRSFHITAATLDPRPETETVISMVLDHVQAHNLDDAPLRIVDVGTGSGALLVTLLAELPCATGLGVDLSSDALTVAEANAVRHGVKDRARFERRDGVSELPGTFEIFVANPPYIATHEIDTLMPDVRNFDPHSALDGGADGLKFYRAWAAHCPHLVPNGLAVFEVGFDQAEAVTSILKEAWRNQDDVEITTARDLLGHVRCVAALTLQP